MSLSALLVGVEIAVHIAAYHTGERRESFDCCSTPSRSISAPPPKWETVTPGIGVTHGLVTVGGLRDSIGNPSYYGGLVFGREWGRYRVRGAALAMYRERDIDYSRDGLFPAIVPSAGVKLGPVWVDASYLHGAKQNSSAVLFSVSMGVGRI